MDNAHYQSLLRVPLVNFIINQNEVELIERPIDCNWFYNTILPVSCTGFNPFCGKLFYGKHSAISNWLPNAHESAMLYNHEEWLVYELLFLIHDYLHIWAIGELTELLNIQTNKEIILNKNNTSILEFIYIISEAAATVGLDYWYLSKINLNSICPINTEVRGLTTTYREDDIGMYTKLNKNFKVQSPNFFKWMVKGYCTGTFEGFNVSDLKSNKKLMSWLGQELHIGSKQLRFIRIWLSYLNGSNDDIHLFNEPIDITSPIRAIAIEELSQRLWNVFNHNEMPKVKSFSLNIQPENAYNLGPHHLDYRFTTANTATNSNLDYKSMETEQFKYFISQFIASFLYKKDTTLTKKEFEEAIRSRDFIKIQTLLQKHERCQPAQVPMSSLVFIN